MVCSRYLPWLLLAVSLIVGLSACSSGGPSLADGEYFGFVDSVADGTLVFDPAEWFGGDAAGAAAVEDGVIKQPGDLDDPFYVRNPKVEQLKLKVDAKAQFTLYVAPPNADLVQRTISLQELARLSKPGTEATTPAGESYYAGFPNCPMRLTISGGEVTAAAASSTCRERHHGTAIIRRWGPAT